MDHLVVSIHQPNYFPWLGYFFKIYASDIFIFLDDVTYSSSSLTKRCFLRKQVTSSDKTYLRIPLQKYQYPAPLLSLQIDHQQAWQERQRNQILSVYQKSPYFKTYFPLVEELLNASRKDEKLIAFNERVILKMLEVLNIPTKIIRSSNLPVTGKKADYVLGLVKYCQANIYLSGTGAKKYQEEAIFAAEKIKIVYNEIFGFLAQKKYPQHQGEFLNGLSILDALFNIGAAGIQELFELYQSQLDLSPFED
ncbi:MAG: WbqC family protein [Saprospiraceae bacterium]